MQIPQLGTDAVRRSSLTPELIRFSELVETHRTGEAPLTTGASLQTATPVAWERSLVLQLRCRIQQSGIWRQRLRNGRAANRSHGAGSRWRFGSRPPPKARPYRFILYLMSTTQACENKSAP